MITYTIISEYLDLRLRPTGCFFGHRPSYGQRGFASTHTAAGFWTLCSSHITYLSRS